MEPLPSNKSLITRGQQVVMNTYGRLPVTLIRGEGSWVWDADHKRYLDLIGGIAVNCLGHSHPRLNQVIAEQSQQLLHVSNLYWNLPQIELAEALVLQSFAQQVFFCNSGAEANEGAVKLARKYFYRKQGQPHRFKIICFHHAFHGRTLAMITATGKQKYLEGYDPLPEGFVHLPFGDLEALQKALDEKTAAVLIEPIQGEGGIHLAEADFLKNVKSLCHQNGSLLIYDEVQTGIGRTGKLFAYEHSEVTPDIMTLAKGLAGGIPIGAILATEEVAQAFQPGDHASTFGGNPFATRVALEVLKVIQEEKLLENVILQGQRLRQGLSALKMKYPQMILEVRGKGLLIGMELSFPGQPLVLKGLEKGVLLNCTQENVIRFAPPLIVNAEQVELTLQTIDALLNSF